MRRNGRNARSRLFCRVQALQHENLRIGKVASFSYTVNGELNSFGAPVQGVVGLIGPGLTVRIALTHRLRPCQSFWTRGSDAINATQREPPDPGALVSSHQFPVKSANIARTSR